MEEGGEKGEEDEDEDGAARHGGVQREGEAVKGREGRVGGRGSRGEAGGALAPIKRVTWSQWTLY